jgi:hypothetical protein
LAIHGGSAKQFFRFSPELAIQVVLDNPHNSPSNRPGYALRTATFA